MATIQPGVLDHDLQVVRDAGLIPKDVDRLYRKHDPWIRRTAAGSLRLFPGAANLYDVDDVAQVVRESMWRSLVDYRYQCPAGECRKPTVRTGRPGRPRRHDWSCEKIDEWRSHAREVHEPGFEPGSDVGRYVRFIVRRRTGMRLKAMYALKRRHFPDDDESESLRDLITAPSGDALVIMRELTDLGVRALTPLARRFLQRLADGYSTREAIKIESSGIERLQPVARQNRRRILDRECVRAQSFLQLACSRLS